MKYKRILLKLSGESLVGDGEYGIDSKMLAKYANEIKSVVKKNIQLAIVIGGGNIYRGVESEGAGFDRVQGDHMGMLATIINGMALQSALESLSIETRLLTAIRMEQVAEPYIRRKAMRHLQKGRVVIFGGGTGLKVKEPRFLIEIYNLKTNIFILIFVFLFHHIKNSMHENQWTKRKR